MVILVKSTLACSHDFRNTEVTQDSMSPQCNITPWSGTISLYVLFIYSFSSSNTFNVSIFFPSQRSKMLIQIPLLSLMSLKLVGVFVFCT